MDQKVAVVTGASSGIGVGIARHLAQNGYKNLAILARRQEKLEEVKKELLELGAKAVLVLKVDLTNDEDCALGIEQIKTQFSRIDLLVNNAGAYFGVASVKDKPLENVRKMIDLNFTAQVSWTKLALPMIEACKGNIVFISSIAAQCSFKGFSDYGASKVALDYFTKILAREEASEGVRVNTVSPGAILVNALGFESPEIGQTVLANAQPLKICGQVDDVAAAVGFLASDKAKFITGANLVVDGGALTNYCIDFDA
eukprot:maker-scaffold470_size172058-snap-gene-0.37 protein:Tk09903 transcript:maker-scaffold470_size172058-snap-gene-0.37-mRNA-1 annotation:"GJ15354"